MTSDEERGSTVFLGAGEIWSFSNEIRLLIEYFRGVAPPAEWANYIFNRACCQEFQLYEAFNSGVEFEGKLLTRFMVASDEQFFDTTSDSLCNKAVKLIEEYRLDYWIYNYDDGDKQHVADVTVDRFNPYYYLVLRDNFTPDRLYDGWDILP